MDIHETSGNPTYKPSADRYTSARRPEKFGRNTSLPPRGEMRDLRGANHELVAGYCIPGSDGAPSGYHGIKPAGINALRPADQAVHCKGWPQKIGKEKIVGSQA